MTGLLLALALAADTGPSPVFEWDVPAAVAQARVGDDALALDGLPLRVYLARSRWDGEQLLRHYTARFEAAGFFIPPKLQPMRGFKLPRVTALDPERMISYIVWTWPEPDGTWSLVLGSANLGARRPRAGAGGLPQFPGAAAATSFNLEFAQGLTFRARATQDEVIAFYRATLPSGGWREREPGSFEKGGRLVRVLAKPDGKELSVVVLNEPDLPSLGPRVVGGGAVKTQ